ncbi:exopolysaccharide biosynthesis protein VpsH [soil metagenome]
MLIFGVIESLLNLSTSIYNNSPVWMQNILVSAYGWQWKHRRFGGIFKGEYHNAKERENFTAAQWEHYQSEQLQKIITHAFEHVPFYRNNFAAKGITIAALQSVTPQTLSLLPVLTKEMLRLHGTTTLLANNKEKGGSFFASSGSTGTPVQILFSHAMHQRWMGIFEARVRNWAGVNSFEPRGMIGGRRVVANADEKPPYYRYNYFEKQVYFSAYHISKNNVADYLQGMQKHHLHYMTGYAMSNFFLARFLKTLNIPAPQLKAVITSSEKLTYEMRQVFKEVYGCKTFDGWSGVEACGLITECEHGSLHINPDAGLLEVLDDNMQSVPSGTAGNVYCTGFLNYDQPLIRYNIGDSIILTDKTCSCGRQMPVAQEIVGRTEDTIVGKDGRQMVRFHSVFNGLPSIKLAQVIQETADTIVIKIIPDKKADEKEKNLICRRIISQLGEINILIEEVENIPLNNNGKFQAVVSKLKK